jgi:hypothetical protein
MTHSESWYHALSVKLGHRGFVTVAEIRKAELVAIKEVSA